MTTFPLNAQKIEGEWKLFVNRLAYKLPAYHNRLNGPAALSDIQELERIIGVRLPESVTALYVLNNGEDESWFVGGIMCGMRMLTIKGIRQELEVLKKIEEENQFNKDWKGNILPEGRVKKLSHNSMWIPLFTDNNGNYIGLDLDPGLKGVIGQVINFGRDENDHFVVADSIDKFLNLINSEFEKAIESDAIFQDDQGVEVMFGLRRESHLIDDLKSIAIK